MSARDLDHPDDGVDRRIVRAALAGDEGARAVLAARLRAVPLAVARVAGADGGADGGTDGGTAFVDRATRALADVARHLDRYGGEPALEEWAIDLARRSVEATGAADDPEALADEVDVPAILDEVLPRRSTRRSGGAREGLRRARHALRVGLVATVIALFFWADPQLDEESGASADDVVGGKVRLEHPIGAVSAFDRFEWRGAGDEGYSATVIVTAEDGSTITSPPLATDVWEPRPGLLDSFGDRIRWEVVVRFDGDVQRGWAYAWRNVR